VVGWRSWDLRNLGSAFFTRKGFARQGFRIAAIFDDDSAKMGSTADGVPILPLRDLPREAKARNLQLAIVAVPAESAQPVTETLVAAGIKAILNFAPGRLRAPKDVRFKSVDLSIELETLSFYLVQGPRA
jgi:redox-sensing transcriptional repressor